MLIEYHAGFLWGQGLGNWLRVILHPRPPLRFPSDLVFWAISGWQAEEENPAENFLLWTSDII